MMHRVSVTAFGAALLLAGPALAADMPAPAPMPEPVPAPAPAPVYYNWSGFYAGVQGGYAWGDRDITVPGFPAPPAARKFSYDSDGWLLGGQVGVNWQMGQWVLGAEADLAWTGVDGRLTPAAAALPGNVTGASESHDMKWLGTLRGRLGFAVDSFLFYGTGGLAFAKIDGTAVFRTGGTTFGASDSNTHTGWTLGAGVEAGLTENISVKAEYLYVDLGSKNYHYAFGGGMPTTTVNADHQHHVVRAGLNYRFSW